MIRATVKNGALQALEPLPNHWLDGRELIVEEADGVDLADEDWDRWEEETRELASRIPPGDFDRLENALAEADRMAKELVRREMGLP